jgi:uncharacterized protein (TIGR02996 family)
VAKPRARKTPPPTPARDEELEGAILRDPSSPMAYLVYGDWLQQKGDPRGELIALHAALADAPPGDFPRLKAAEEALLSAHAAQFYGPLGRFPSARRTHLEWYMGFVEEICPRAAFEPEAFLSHPSARFVQIVAGRGLTAPPACLRRLRAYDSELAWVWSAPLLEELQVDQGPKVSLGEPRHERLARLEIHRPSGHALQALARAELPGLRELALWGVRPSVVPLVVALLDRFPDVRFSLGLGFEEAGSFAALAPIASRVEELCLDRIQGELLASLRSLSFENAATLRVTSVPDGDERDTYFDLLPELPAVKQVRLIHSAELVRYCRSFARSALARRIERLGVHISRPAAGRALCEVPYENVTELDMQWEGTLSPEYLESARALAADAFPSVQDLRLGPVRHLASLVASPMAPRLRKLTIDLHAERDAAHWFEHRGRFDKLESLTIGGDRTLSRQTLERIFDQGVKITWARRSR